MLTPIYRQRFSTPMRALVTFVLTAFLAATLQPAPAFAQAMRHTPSPTFMLQPASVYSPMLFKGIQLVPENPLRFDFLVDKGNSDLNNQDLREESTRLVKYFLTALTIPEKDMWVNLSPYEEDSIITDSLIQTEMGKVLLEQDYVLKKMTASLTFPETTLGRQFWGRVYQKAYEMYGTTDIPINTFNKVWVTPLTADVVVYDQGAVIVDSQLDVMVESDYLALQKNSENPTDNTSASGNVENTEEDNRLYSNIIKEIIIPELRKEVNQGKYFAPLRQVYQAMILATWYKRNLKNGLLSKIYVRQNKVDGVSIDDPKAKEKIYEEYLETFRKGVYNYIREDFDAMTQETIPRKYTSGGMEFNVLGLGGEGDRYREVNPSALNGFKIMSGPLVVSADLTLLTPSGDRVGLPSPVGVFEARMNDSFPKDGTQKHEVISSSKKGILTWVRKITMAVSMATVFTVGILFPSYGAAAEFSQDDKGNLIVQVKPGDTYGEIVQQMQAAYRSTDAAGYKESKLAGPLWGPQGVVQKISAGKNVNQLMPNDEFKFEKGFLPQEVVNKLAPRVDSAMVTTEAQMTVPTADQATNSVDTTTEIKETISGDHVQKDGVTHHEVRQASNIPAPELGVESVPLDLLAALGGLVFFWGARKVLSTGKKSSTAKRPAIPKVKVSEPPVEAALPAESKSSIRFITEADEFPSPDDVSESESEKRVGVFVGEDEPMASDEENELWEKEQKAKSVAVDPGTRSHVRTARAVWPMDVLGSGLGMVLAGVTSDWNLQAMGISALVMPFLTRIFYGVQVFLHESLGHFIPALALSPEREKVLTTSNFFGNFGWAQWARLSIAGLKAPAADEVPFVETGATGWRKRVIDVSGFVVSLGVAVVAGMESMHVWLPLIGPVGVSSLMVLAGSYSTDIKGNKILSQSTEESCTGSQCGIFGALWLDDSDDLYPQWIREGFAQLINALIIRGGQSAGEFTIGIKSSGEVDGSAEGIPILSKVLKYKRGTGLTETLDHEFARLVNLMQKKKVTALQGIKGILGHVRFATGGKVTREASHPHMGIQEKHEVWTLVAGQWVKKIVNVFAAIGHNGDNDIWKVWGLRLNTAQMRELFPAIFRMKKTFKIVTNKKDPVTGKKVKEVKYEALPPGDSPPIALQMHYLLTQGDWLASARLAYAEQVINQNVASQLESTVFSDKEMAEFVEQKLRQAVEMLLTEQEEMILSEVFEVIFLRHADALRRPRLKKSDKSLKDLWVTPEMVAAAKAAARAIALAAGKTAAQAEEEADKKTGGLQAQVDRLDALREDLRNSFMQQIQEPTNVSKALKKAGGLNGDVIEQFVNTAVEKFFTGGRAAAVKEFAERSEGTYGVALRTSKEPDGITLYSNDQGITIGYNQKAKLVTFSSEHATLQYAFGSKGKMDDLVFLNPEHPGQMADVNLSRATEDAADPISIKVHSFALGRIMKPEEIRQQQFPQDPSNPYWSPQVSYKDRNDIVMTDINTITKEVRSARQSWDNPDSFNRQSADPLLEKMASRHLELYIKANSEFYGAAHGQLAARLFSKATECQAGGGCTPSEANRRSALLSNRLLADGRISDYLKSRLDWVVGRLADQLAAEMISGNLDETGLVVRFRQNIDERLKILLDREIKEIVDAVILDHLNALQSWKDWEEGETISKETEKEVIAQDNQQDDFSDGVIRKGLKAIAKLVSRFMSPDAPKPEDVHLAEGRSLDSGETDMMIAGYEDSLWLGENFVDMMKALFPKMKIWATSANKAFNLNGEHRVGRRTLSMIISKSGATFPSRGIVRRLKQITPGNIFAMTSRVDTLIAMALGQKFQSESPFIKRIFVTGNYYPAEANSVGEVMLFAHQIELVLYLAERMQGLFPEQRPWGMNLTGDDIVRLKELRDNMYDEARRLTGHNENGSVIDGRYVRHSMIQQLRNGYLHPRIKEYLAETRSGSRRLDTYDIKNVITRVIRYNGPDADSNIQSTLLNLLSTLQKDEDWETAISSVMAESHGTIDKIDEHKITDILIDLIETKTDGDLKKMTDSYLRPYNDIVDNGNAIGKTMAETGIVSNIVFRIFVMSIFWFGAPIENIFSAMGFQFGPTLHDLGSMAVRTLDGLLALCAPWLMTTLVYRTWSGRPHWARLGPPTIALGDSNPALHQTAENFWSKLGAVALGSMTMNIHGANPDDHFVARLAHRVVRGTIAIFGVPIDPTGKENVIVTMKQTKAIINGMFLNFFKGGAEVFSVGRGELNNPDVTDHHIDIGEQNLEGASKTVKKFNKFAFDAFGRFVTYKVLFAYAYDWAIKWEPRITLFGRTLSLKKFYLWNDGFSYSYTSVHSTKSPIGGSTEGLPTYLDPAQDGGTGFDPTSGPLLKRDNEGGGGSLMHDAKFEGPDLRVVGGSQSDRSMLVKPQEALPDGISASATALGSQNFRYVIPYDKIARDLHLKPGDSYLELSINGADYIEQARADGIEASHDNPLNINIRSKFDKVSVYIPTTKEAVSIRAAIMAAKPGGLIHFKHGGIHSDSSIMSHLLDRVPYLGRQVGATMLLEEIVTDEPGVAVFRVVSKDDAESSLDKNVNGQPDKEMAAVRSASSENVRPIKRKGGIDLNTKWLDLRVSVDGTIELYLDNQNIESLPIRGIVPVIRDIHPINMDNIFLLIENYTAPGALRLTSDRWKSDRMDKFFSDEKLLALDVRLSRKKIKKEAVCVNVG